MAAHRVVRSAKARKDLRGLYAWVVENGGLERAEATLVRLDSAISRLARRPLSGRPPPDFGDEPGSFSVQPWLAVYEPLPDGAGIQVLPILDSRQDTAALIGKKS